jgi:hypothetical protein
MVCGHPQFLEERRRLIVSSELLEIFRYSHDVGFGEAARGEALDDDMAELDMPPGTDVQVIAHDDESGWPLVQWADKTGNTRITTIDPDVFDRDFIKVEE